MDSRDTCIFYKSIYEAINMLQTDAEKAQIYDAIFAYSFEFIEPKLNGTCLMIWKLIEPVLKKGNTNYINGSKPKKKAKQKRNRSETEANNKPNASEAEAYKDKDKDKDKDKENDKDMDIYIPSASLQVAPKPKNKGKHLFKNSEYFDPVKFTEAFKSTPCFGRHPNLDIELIYDMMVNSEAKGYMYVDWIKAAANWVSREPHKYTKSIKSAIQKDPAFALMTKGDIARAEHNAKMALQRKLINKPDDPYSY